MVFGILIALQRDTVNVSVEGGVVVAHIVFEHSVELRQGCNRADIQSIKPAFFERAEMSLHLIFAGSVTDFCMQKQETEGYADHGKLLIGVAAAIVYIKFIGNSVGGDGIF